MKRPLLSVLQPHQTQKRTLVLGEKCLALGQKILKVEQMKQKIRMASLMKWPLRMMLSTKTFPLHHIFQKHSVHHMMISHHTIHPISHMTCHMIRPLQRYSPLILKPAQKERTWRKTRRELEELANWQLKGN